MIYHQFALQFLKDSLRAYEDRVIFHEVRTDVGFNERLDVPYKDVGFFSRSVEEKEVVCLKRQHAIKSDETVVFMAIGMKMEF